MTTPGPHLAAACPMPCTRLSWSVGAAGERVDIEGARRCIRVGFRPRTQADDPSRSVRSRYPLCDASTEGGCQVAALDDLLARVTDPALRADLEREIAPLRGEQALGLVFERHLPESVRLPGHPIRRGLTVTDRTGEDDGEVWQATRVTAGVAHLRRADPDEGVVEDTRPVERLVVVREFGEPIYPGLKSVGQVERGGDRPWHVAINAENYHALETLLYTCEGLVDAIYIDPPYNTGARDWKYNNDYVDGNDRNRHSKWLSFMEKRLQLAKRLLNPDNSVLIVTIDEKEVLRLGLLLEQVFPSASIQMVSVVINPNGSARKNELARVEEYAFILGMGAFVPSALDFDLLSERGGAPEPKPTVRWEWLLRGGGAASRADRPNLFYPVWVDPDAKAVVEVGDPLPLETDRASVPPREGLVAVWPLRSSGAEGRWRMSADTLRERLAAGQAKVGAYDRKRDKWSLLYLGAAQLRRIETGELRTLGRDANGVMIVESADEGSSTISPKTVWNLGSHRSGEHGSGLLRKFLPSRTFPFPKSLYLVEDTLRIAVADKPCALIVDFFAGSGTTAHAVARLNKQDGGRRRSISVSNNEVSPDEAKALRDAGHAPGDPEWEAQGIFEHITQPRITAALTGQTPDGDPVRGDYKFVDEFPMSEGFDENVEFFRLTYEDADRVRLGATFEAVAPLLWLRAGAEGPRIDSISAEGWALPDGARYGVLFRPDGWPPFVEAVRASETVRQVFIVTDSDAVFQQVTAELPDQVVPVRLYESYLASFAINTGGVV